MRSPRYEASVALPLYVSQPLYDTLHNECGNWTQPELRRPRCQAAFQTMADRLGSFNARAHAHAHAPSRSWVRAREGGGTLTKFW